MSPRSSFSRALTAGSADASLVLAVATAANSGAESSAIEVARLPHGPGSVHVLGRHTSSGANGTDTSREQGGRARPDHAGESSARDFSAQRIGQHTVPEEALVTDFVGFFGFGP